MFLSYLKMLRVGRINFSTFLRGPLIICIWILLKKRGSPLTLSCVGI
ncbi:hypothetical protein NEOC65_000916 [Neochlamydia sp. AcF65]|nr:hypothetical protein [Neochlamydia sp. AcF65]